MKEVKYLESVPRKFWKEYPPYFTHCGGSIAGKIFIDGKTALITSANIAGARRGYWFKSLSLLKKALAKYGVFI